MYLCKRISYYCSIGTLCWNMYSLQQPAREKTEYEVELKY